MTPRRPVKQTTSQTTLHFKYIDTTQNYNTRRCDANAVW